MKVAFHLHLVQDLGILEGLAPLPKRVYGVVQKCRVGHKDLPLFEEV